MNLLQNIFQLMTYQTRKPFKIQALMGFKHMTKYYSAFETSKEKAYEILKERANGMKKHDTYNILAFMGFQTIISNKKNPISSNIRRH